MKYPMVKRFSDKCLTLQNKIVTIQINNFTDTHIKEIDKLESNPRTTTADWIESISLMDGQISVSIN